MGGGEIATSFSETLCTPSHHNVSDLIACDASENGWSASHNQRAADTWHGSDTARARNSNSSNSGNSACRPTLY
jgi:hypothetical protein